MHSLLSRLLAKRGYKSISDLSSDPMPDGSPSERETLENWNRVLSAKNEVTVENIAEFCNSQLQQISSQMRSLDNSTQKNERLVLLHSVYTALGEAIKSPNKEREALEKYLTGLVNSP